MRTPPELNLLTHFQALPDPRVARTPEHKLLDILVIAICTLLCGGEGFNDMEDFGDAKHDWFKTFLELPNGIPSSISSDLICWLRGGWAMCRRTAARPK